MLPFTKEYKQEGLEEISFKTEVAFIASSPALHLGQSLNPTPEARPGLHGIQDT